MVSDNLPDTLSSTVILATQLRVEYNIVQSTGQLAESVGVCVCVCVCVGGGAHLS